MVELGIGSSSVPFPFRLKDDKEKHTFWTALDRVVKEYLSDLGHLFVLTDVCASTRRREEVVFGISNFSTHGAYGRDTLNDCDCRFSALPANHDFSLVFFFSASPRTGFADFERARTERREAETSRTMSSSTPKCRESLTIIQDPPNRKKCSLTSLSMSTTTSSTSYNTASCFESSVSTVGRRETAFGCITIISNGQDAIAYYVHADLDGDANAGGETDPQGQSYNA